MAQILEKPRDVIQVFKDLSAVVVQLYGIGALLKFQFLAGTGAEMLLKNHIVENLPKDATDKQIEDILESKKMVFQSIPVIVSSQMPEYSVSIIKIVAHMGITSGLPKEG